MAEQFLEDIYRRSALVTKMRRGVDALYVNVRWKGIELLEEILPELFDLCKEAADAGYPKARHLFETIMNATKLNDAVSIIEAYEREIIPMTLEYINTYGRIELQADEDYYFESSDSGFLTLKDTKIDKYIHCTTDPLYEAWKNIEYYYKPMKTTYRIYGCGLGYHLYALYAVSLRTADIILYEPDERMVEYARQYGVLDWIPKDHLTIVTDNAQERYIKERRRTEFEDFWMLPVYPDLEEDKDYNMELTQIGMELVLGPSLERRETINFSKNVQANPVDISEIDISLFKREMILVGAGPTLSECYDFLRESKGKRTIIAVGTVMRRLLAENIVPDVFVVLDSTYLIHPQIEGIEDCNVPMVYSSTTNWQTVTDYRGPKYMLNSNSLKVVRDYIEKNGYLQWSNGGSVLTLAMALANGMGAEKIYLVGADMAYTNGQAHAAGTATRSSVETVREDFEVPSVSGGTVSTDYTLTKYRLWFERYIAENRHLQVYNLSGSGARIKGTIEVDHDGGKIWKRRA